MKKLLLLIVAGVVSTTVAYAADPPTAETTFELTYHGLTALDDPRSYRSFWGFGQSLDTDTPFIADVKKHVEEYDLVYNAYLPEAAKWSLVELKDGKAVAFYLDTNADGALSANEKFLPTALCENPSYQCVFITSDFMIANSDGDEVPFRVMLVGYGDADNLNYMWSPGAVLEGQATLDGEPTRLVMYADGFRGSFSTFRNCSIALGPASEPADNVPSRQPLSRLLYYKGTFYRLTLTGAHAKGQTLSVVMEKDTTPTGQIDLHLAGSEPLTASLASKTVQGADDNTVYFRVAGSRNTFPAGAYQLLTGTIRYEADDGQQWQVTVNEGPRFNIAAGVTSTLALGAPTVKVNAVAEDKRYDRDVEPTTTFDTGTAIYITPQLTGKAGETYQRFPVFNISTKSKL